MVNPLKNKFTNIKKWGQAHFFNKYCPNRKVVLEKMSQSPFFRDAGFTLIEMLVAMTIAGIFFAAFTAVVVATMQTMRTGDQRTVAQQNARIAINFLGDEIKQMSELEAPPFTEYRDPRTGGLPTKGDIVDYTQVNEVYPIIRRSTDGSARGYIDLNHVDATGGIDEYEMFREGLTGTSDGMPYDVRPLFPNRIDFLMNQSSYFPSTRYSSLDPDLIGGIIDLDGISSDLANNSDNFQSAPIRISYEQQKQPPRTGLYPDEGALKDLYLTVFGVAGGGVNLLNEPFVLLRSFEVANVTNENPFNFNINQTLKYYPLVDPDGNDLGVDLPAPAPNLRQIVADHVLDLRFRYFYVRGGAWIEIRYDPYTEHMDKGGSGLPPSVNDGYYRYYDEKGNEIYVWATPADGKIDIPTSDIVQEYKDNYSDLTFMPVNEFERGLLLFEGWRFVNTIMINVRSANQELQDIYFRTVANEISSPSSGNYAPNHPEFGLGFVDFQRGGDYLSSENAADPLWHAVDSYREGVHINPMAAVIPPDGPAGPFDFVEPNSNPTYDPGRFVTLQTMVAPPVLKGTAVQAVRRITYGLSYV